MIAVFVRDSKILDEFHITPKNSFKRITKVEDICGITFTCVITTYRWFESNRQIQDAYDELKQRQPELFKK